MCKKTINLLCIISLLSCSRNNDMGLTQRDDKIKSLKESNMGFRIENAKLSDAPSIPKALFLSSSSVYQNSIYITDGASIYEFNTTNNQWRKNGDISSSTNPWSNLLVNSNYSFVFGGLKNISQKRDKVDYISNLDLKNRGSFTINDVLNVQQASIANAYGYYYIAGGNVGKKYKNEIYRFKVYGYPNPKIEELEKVTEMPEAMNTQIEILNQKIYVIGGYNEHLNGGLASRAIRYYDMKNKEWHLVGEMPYGFSAHATDVYDGKIWIVGNYNLNDQQLAYYDTNKNEFVTINSNIRGRRHCNAEIVNGKLYILSGNMDESSSSIITNVQVMSLKD